jgi:predicted 3-demethylubiquinone-9 3-methyltransferase (glyoxalase superfamily)
MRLSAPPERKDDTMATLPKITACLWFDTQGEEAATFYASIFRNSRITNVTRYGSAGPRPAGMVMTVEFELDGVPFTALNGGPDFTFNEAISLQVNCDTQSEIDDFWTKLTAGGGEAGPCGWLKDKFGVSWQIVPTILETLVSDPDTERAQRAMKAMLGMGKLDIAELQRAADAA